MHRSTFHPTLTPLLTHTQPHSPHSSPATRLAPTSGAASISWLSRSSQWHVLTSGTSSFTLHPLAELLPTVCAFACPTYLAFLPVHCCSLTLYCLFNAILSSLRLKPYSSSNTACTQEAGKRSPPPTARCRTTRGNLQCLR